MMNALTRERAKKKSFYIHPSTVFRDRLNLFYLPQKSPSSVFVTIFLVSLNFQLNSLEYLELLAQAKNDEFIHSGES